MYRLLLKRKSLVLLISILNIQFAYAIQDQQPQQKSGEPKPTSKVTKNAVDNNDHWIESFHDTVSNSVFQSAVWFDKFFLDEESEQAAPKRQQESVWAGSQKRESGTSLTQGFA